MINLFRKARTSLFAGEKLGRYLKYAFGEVILVVIGILIAVQLNNWNENRKDRIEEERIINQLQEEFIINKQKLLDINAQNDAVLQALERILDAIPINTNTIDLDVLSNNLKLSCDFNTFDPLEGTIAELENNSFKIISDQKLRTLLLSWNTVKEDFKDDQDFAIDYAKDYNMYMQKHVSLDFGLKRANTDLSFLTGIEFENWVRVRQMYYSDIVDSEDYNRLATLINDIITLTNSKH